MVARCLKKKIITIFTFYQCLPILSLSIFICFSYKKGKGQRSQSSNVTYHSYGWPAILSDSRHHQDHYRIRRSSSQNNRELRLVLLGTTGSGKSSSANTIIGREVFKADGSSITYKCNHHTTKIQDLEILVVDTPDLFDTRQDTQSTFREITRFVGLSAPGPHAFILVVQCSNRQTEQVQRYADIIMGVFGNQARR